MVIKYENIDRHFIDTVQRLANINSARMHLAKLNFGLWN